MISGEFLSFPGKWTGWSFSMEKTGERFFFYLFFLMRMSHKNKEWRLTHKKNWSSGAPPRKEQRPVFLSSESRRKFFSFFNCNTETLNMQKWSFRGKRKEKNAAIEEHSGGALLFLSAGKWENKKGESSVLFDGIASYIFFKLLSLRWKCSKFE